MITSRSRIALVGLAAAVLPIAPACSRDDSSTIKPPTSQEAPDPSLGNVPAIRISMECGSRQPEQANDPEAFDAEHILLTNDGTNVFSIEHFQHPTEIRFTDDSSEGFMDAVNLSKETLGPVALPEGATGSAMIFYSGTTEGDTYAYFLDITGDGIITLTNETELDSSVAVGTEPSKTSTNAISLMFLGDKESSSFLEPEKDEWDNVADAPQKPKSSEDAEFAPLEGGNGAFLNRVIDDPAVSAGAQVYDSKNETACVALLGPIARAPRAMHI